MAHLSLCRSVYEIRPMAGLGRAVSWSHTDAWFEKELARRAAEDPQFMAKIKPAQNGSPQPAQSIVKMPPSLSRVSSAADNSTAGSMADADLYAFAKT